MHCGDWIWLLFTKHAVLLVHVLESACVTSGKCIAYSGNHHTWNNNFLVLLMTTFEFISIIISSNANLTT